MRSTPEKLILWEQQINERITSGMTIDEWCKKNVIRIYEYQYWNDLIN